MANLPNETLQLARRAAQECRALRSLINNNQPTNEALQTSTKGALVDAVNELADRPLANATTVATVIGAASSKASPELNDQLALTDSSAAGALRRISWSQLRTALKSYLDTFYSTLSWSSITSKPSTFPPSEHTHSSGDVIDATSTDVPDTIVKRDTNGGAIIKWLTLPAGSGGIVFDSGGGITNSILAYNDGAVTSAAEFSLPIGTGFGCLTSDPGGVPDNLYPSDPASVRWNLGVGSAGDSIFQASDFSGVGSVRYMLGLDVDQSPLFAGLSLSSGTMNASNPLLISQTWNAGAVVFKAIEINVTDTASAADSYLIDLRADAQSKFRVTTQPTTGANSSGFRWEGNSSGGVFLINVSGNSASIAPNGNHDVSLAEGGLVIYRTGVGGGVRIGTSSNGPRLFADPDADHTLAQRNGTSAQVFRLYDTRVSATDYHRLSIATVRATATMAGASVTLTNLIPAGAVVVGVTCKVTNAITGAPIFNIGTATDNDRFGANRPGTLGSVTDNRNWTAGTIECFPTATSIILTALGSNFTGGTVYVSVQYLTGQAN